MGTSRPGGETAEIFQFLAAGAGDMALPKVKHWKGVHAAKKKKKKEFFRH